MHESQPHAVTEPSLTDRTVEGSAARDVFDAERDAPEAVLFAAPTEGRTTTAAELATRVRALAAALIADGVGPGDRVLLMSRTRAEWSIADYAIWAAGAVTVPIYETSSAEQVAWIASDSAATAAIVETTTQAGIVGGLPEGARPRAVRCIDAGDLDGLPAPAADVAEEIRRRTQAVAPEDVATVVSTS